MYPDAKFGFRGSLATGVKYKSNTAFNPGDWDVDAFIVSDNLATEIGNSSFFRDGRNIIPINNIADDLQLSFKNMSGFNSKLNKPFTFRVWAEAELIEKVKPFGPKNRQPWTNKGISYKVYLYCKTNIQPRS